MYNENWIKLLSIMNIAKLTCFQLVLSYSCIFIGKSYKKTIYDLVLLVRVYI